MGRKIMLDPGHGGFDPGAIGPSGLREASVTLAVSRKLAAYLSPVVEVFLTRTTDTALGADVNGDLAKRTNMANVKGADLFISIHCNSAADASAHGVETYALAAGGEGEKLARLVQAQLVEATGLRNRGVKYANYYVLRKTNMPAILVELAFISNLAEEKDLSNPDFQDVCARAIAAGVKQYFGIKEEVSAVQEEWKVALMKWGQQKETLNLADTHQPDEPAPKWFVLAVAQRVLEAAKAGK